MDWIRIRHLAIAAAVVCPLGLAGCFGGDDSGSSGTAQSFDKNKDVTITVWSGFTPGEREIGVFDSVVEDFEKKYPNVHVDSVAGVNDDKIVAAIRAGNAPDVALSFSSDNTGAFCGSGAWIDLQPYIDRDNVDINAFPEAVRTYTEYNGTRCAMPLLADDYGLYYNKDMFAKAGIKGPPKTISELDADAKKLTTNSGDDLDVVGFDPSIGFYENAAAHYAPPWDAQWFDGDEAAFASDPAWADMLDLGQEPDRLVRV